MHLCFPELGFLCDSSRTRDPLADSLQLTMVSAHEKPAERALVGLSDRICRSWQATLWGSGIVISDASNQERNNAFPPPGVTPPCCMVFGFVKRAVFESLL
jgi:hypothetical protein